MRQLLSVQILSVNCNAETGEMKAGRIVTVEPTGRTREVGGVQAAGYRFEHRYDLSASSRGVAWIDPATGAPLLLEATYDPLPPFTHDLRISMQYRYEDPLTWFPVRVEVLVKAKLLIVEKNIRSVSVLTDHRLPDFPAPP